ncbi:MAG: hypothetical protein NT011_13620 [Kiritimatiellaeota bacterium]|nr:hypothetical protein [Kiritimatiellota bacterium]
MNEIMRNLVDTAIKIEREIAEREAKLKDIKGILIMEAEECPNDQVATEGGGRSWTLEGKTGCIARVTFPSPTLKDKISGVGKTIEKIMQAAGKRFADLFEQVPAYRPKPDFRKLLDTQLDAVEARKLLKLCSTESAPRVSFETKENHE